MLGLGNSIGGYVSSGLWLPSDEGSLEAWYRFNTGITLDGSNVEAWADSSSNTFAMRQTDTGEQPAFSAGVLTFDPSSDTQNLQSSSTIELDGEFVIGFKINPAASNVVILGSNSTSSEMFKIFESADRLRVKKRFSYKRFYIK